MTQLFPGRAGRRVQRKHLVPYLGKADLVIAKETAGRPHDLADLEELKRATPDPDSDSQ